MLYCCGKIIKILLKKGIAMKALVTVIGCDKVGIIAGVCVCLANYNVNILDISQNSVKAGATRVDITVTDAEANYLRRYAISKTSTTPSMGRAGTYRFGGHAAVIYMRIRKAGGGGDFMRTQRVRTVLSTLADQCREISYEEARALVDSVMENSTLTNMSTADMVEAMEFAMDLRGVTVEELRLPIDESVSALTYVGMSVQECDFDMCRKALDDYLQNSFLVLD